MRYSQIIAERVFDTVINHKPLFVNPSKREFTALMGSLAASETDPEVVRGLFDPQTGDLYCWDGYYAAHGAIKDRHGLSGAFHLLMYPSRIVVLTLWRYAGLTSEDVHRLLSESRNIQALYGSRVEIEVQP